MKITGATLTVDPEQMKSMGVEGAEGASESYSVTGTATIGADGALMFDGDITPAMDNEQAEGQGFEAGSLANASTPGDMQG